MINELRTILALWLIATAVSVLPRRQHSIVAVAFLASAADSLAA